MRPKETFFDEKICFCSLSIRRDKHFSPFHSVLYAKTNVFNRLPKPKFDSTCKKKNNQEFIGCNTLFCLQEILSFRTKFRGLESINHQVI